jgi:hypothetical protein
MIDSKKNHNFLNGLSKNKIIEKIKYNNFSLTFFKKI